MLLDLPGPERLLYLRPEYAIRLANEAVWEESTGYNNLLHLIRGSETGPDTGCHSPLVLVIRGGVYVPVIWRF